MECYEWGGRVDGGTTNMSEKLLSWDGMTVEDRLEELEATVEYLLQQVEGA